MTTAQAKILTAQELVQLRVKADRTLPIKGTKEFKPSHSWLENKQIQTALDERKALLEEERVEKLGSLAKAEWDSEKKVANVTLKIGRCWMQMGHDVGGKLILFPEEALFLLETNSLELIYNGVAMSIQQAYCTLLGPETGCTVNEYLTYLHLVRQGYTLLRHSKSVRATRYERQIRLDQHTVGQKQRKSKENVPVQEIVIDVGSIGAKPHIQNITSTSTSEKSINSENSEVNKTLLDVKKTVPNSVNNTTIINRESEIGKKQKEIENGIITNEQSNFKTGTSKVCSSNHAGISSEVSKTQSSSNCNNVDKSLSSNQLQGFSRSETSKKITVVQSDKETSLTVLHSEKNESERTNNKGNKIDLPSDVAVVTSVVNVETTAEDSSKTKNSVHDNKTISPNEETDIIIVDDSSTSMDTSEKQRSVTVSDQQTECVGHSDRQKEPNIVQDVTQKSGKQDVPGANVVDISDTSQTSQQDLIEKINSSKNNHAVEVVSLIDDKKDVDDIVEVKYNTFTKSDFSAISKHRKFNQNNTEGSVLKSETQTSLQKNSLGVKGEDCNSVIKNNVSQNSRKITNIQLKHDEIEIMPNVIDLSEDEEKPDIKDEIEVVDLDDEDDDYNRLNHYSWEEERTKILDSIPNIEGKYVMHVRVPDRSLLPPNVSPQKDDYYIHRWNVNEAGLGGRPSIETSRGRRNYTQNNSMEMEEELSPWSPWVQFPSSQPGGGGNVYGAAEMWNNNAIPLLNPFINPQFQPPFFGAFAMQGLFPRGSGMFRNFGGPSWRSSIPSQPFVPFIPHRSRNSYGPRPWHYQRRPYYRRPYYRRKRSYEPHYNSTSVGLGEQNFGNPSTNSNEIIPLKVEDEKPVVKIIDEDDDEVEDTDGDDEDENNDIDIDEEEDEENDDDDDVIECTSASSPIKVEDDIVECVSVDKRTQNGIENCRKRRRSQNQREFEPPKKLRGVIDKLKVEPKQEKNKAEIQENATDAKTWKDVKQIVILDSSSEEEDDDGDDDDEEDDDDDDDDEYEEEDEDNDNGSGDIDDDIFVIVDDFHRTDREKNEPLIQPEHCKDIDSILSKLQIIKSVDFGKIKDAATDKNLRISFDLYMPNPTFRKASPGLPNYRITVFGYEEPIPEPGEIATLLKNFQDDVPLLFAIVLPDAVTFLQCGSIQLPVESFSP